MSSDDLRVRNWEKWQSYRRDRGQPPWIKVHREVMRNPDWVTLTDEQRGQLVALWLLAADKGGKIPSSPEILEKLCYMDSKLDLQVFVDHGFIEPSRPVDATVTPERRQHDAPEAETETEKKQHVRVPPEFEEVWKVHPRGPKKDAAKEYRKAVPKLIPHDKLLVHLKAYVRGFDKGFNGAHLFRWIRDERWEEIEAAPPANGNGQPQGPVRFYR